MIDTKIKYQVGLFGNIKGITPDPEVIKKLIDIFGELQLLPTTFYELDGISQRPCLAMSSSDSGLSVHFGTKRIDIYLRPIDQKGENLGEVKTFIETAADIAEKVCSQFKIKFSRLSLITEYMLHEMGEDEFSKIRKKLLPADINIDGEETTEWNTRTVIKSNVMVLDEEERINSIIQINRMQGEVSNGNDINKFDRIALNLDTNTVHENSDTRFQENEVRSFLEEAEKIQNQIIQKVERLINE